MACLRTQLFSAARIGDADAASKLLTNDRSRPEQTGADRSRQATSSSTNSGTFIANIASLALFEAAEHGHARVVELLLEHGGDVNLKNSSGDTPLHKASEEGHIQVLEVLMRRGAKLSIRNHEGKTPIAVSYSVDTRRVIASEVENRQAVERQRRAEQLRQVIISPNINGATSGFPPKLPSGSALRTPVRVPTQQPLHSLAATTPGTKLHNDIMEQLTCGICLRKFCSEETTAPVTLPCGHNFCQECVSGLKGTADSFRCPMDRTVFSRNLELKVNTTLRDLSTQLANIRIRPAASTPPHPPPSKVATPEAENRDPLMIDAGTSPFIISPAKDRKYPSKDLRDPLKDLNHLSYNFRRENMEHAKITAAKEGSSEDDESTAAGGESTAADSEVHQWHRLGSEEGKMEHVFASTELGQGSTRVARALRKESLIKTALERALARMNERVKVSNPINAHPRSRAGQCGVQRGSLGNSELFEQSANNSRARTTNGPLLDPTGPSLGPVGPLLDSSFGNSSGEMARLGKFSWRMKSPADNQVGNSAVVDAKDQEEECFTFGPFGTFGEGGAAALSQRIRVTPSLESVEVMQSVKSIESVQSMESIELVQSVEHSVMRELNFV